MKRDRSDPVDSLCQLRISVVQKLPSGGFQSLFTVGARLLTVRKRSLKQQARIRRDHSFWGAPKFKVNPHKSKMLGFHGRNLHTWVRSPNSGRCGFYSLLRLGKRKLHPTRRPVPNVGPGWIHAGGWEVTHFWARKTGQNPSFLTPSRKGNPLLDKGCIVLRTPGFPTYVHGKAGIWSRGTPGKLRIQKPKHANYKIA